MREEKKRSRDDEVACVPKKRRSDDSPSQPSIQVHNLTASKPRSHVPMSERQQFALLRQMETEEGPQERGTGDSGLDESSEGPRGAPSRDIDTSADSTLSKDSDSGPSNQHHHHHHSSTRDRTGSSASVHSMSDKSSLRHSNTIQGALMHLIKTGDLDALKQLVREGANVNEQDEHGWTALHEFSSRNLSRLVAYLLRHGARPELADRNGDTALHAASRANHARVVRTLLRHGADPTLRNARGEKPVDLCPDTESGVILNQHMELLHGHSSHPVSKYSSSSSSGRMPRHHHSGGHGPHSSTTASSHNIRHSSASAILSSDPPGLGSANRGPSEANSDSDDACSTPGVGVNPGSMMFNADSLGATTSARAANSPSGGNQRGSYGMEAASKPMQKKDPYAFEDETDDCPDPNTSLHPPSSSLLGKTSSAGSGPGVGGANSTSPTGAIRSRGSGGSVAIPGTGALLSPSSALPPPSLPPPLPPPSSHTTGSSLLPSPGGGDSSGSETTLSLGPPLRLRFAKEAGQYTLMEQQQQQQQQQQQAANSIGTADPSSAQPYPVTDPVESVSGTPATTEPDRPSSGHNPPLQQSTSTEASHDSSQVVTSSNASNGNGSNTSGSAPAEDTECPSSTADVNNEDSNAAQKVPPLRIKFASGTSADTDSGQQNTPTGSGNGDNGIASAENGKERDVTTDPRSGEAGTTVTSSASDLVGSSGGGTVSSPMDVSESGAGSVGTAASVPKHKSPDANHADTHRLGSENPSAEADVDEVRQPTGAVQPHEESQTVGHVRAESENSHETSKDTSSSTKDTHRHRSGRTLRSHTAAQREREEKERHNDTTPIKKRKLRSRTDGHSENGSNRSDSAVWSGAGYNSGNSTSRSHGADDLAPHDSSEPVQPASGQEATSTPAKDDSTGNCSTTSTSTNETRAPKPDTVKNDGGEVAEPEEEAQLISAGSPDAERKSSAIKVESDQEHKMDTSDSPHVTTGKSTGPNASAATSSASNNFPVKSESPNNGNGEGVSYLRCPAGPDDSKQHPELLMYENPFEKSGAIQRKLRELVNSLVEVHPKAPCGYPDYLLVTRNYLLASQTPSLTKRSPPSNLKPAFVELFNEQEEERYAQALKHQSEREHLRLCAEQAVLRAHTRAALAVANLSKPLSFCSVMSYKNLTYVPPTSKTDQRDEENVRDRFTSRTFFGWLEDIKDTFQQEKKKLLCRQLHEAESLMMVQRLDWESKVKESQLHDYGTDALKETPHYHVPLIHVPNDFPLFAHDPVHRTALV